MFFTAISYDSYAEISLLSKMIVSIVSGKNSYETLMVKTKSSSGFFYNVADKMFGCCPFKLPTTVL